MKILKFSLPTCKPCLILSEQMKELDLTDFEIEDISAEKNQDLVEKYNIKNVPTLVILDEQDNETERVRNIVQLKTFLKDYEI